jgi:hypothetical protein
MHDVHVMYTNVHNHTIHIHKRCTQSQVRWVDTNLSELWGIQPLQQHHQRKQQLHPALAATAAAVPWAAYSAGTPLLWNIRRQVLHYIIKHPGAAAELIGTAMPVLSPVELRELLAVFEQEQLVNVTRVPIVRQDTIWGSSSSSSASSSSSSCSGLYTESFTATIDCWRLLGESERAREQK